MTVDGLAMVALGAVIGLVLYAMLAGIYLLADWIVFRAELRRVMRAFGRDFKIENERASENDDD